MKPKRTWWRKPPVLHTRVSITLQQALAVGAHHLSLPQTMYAGGQAHGSE